MKTLYLIFFCFACSLAIWIDNQKVFHVTIGADPKEIRNMMGVVSKSISSSSASMAVQF